MKEIMINGKPFKFDEIDLSHEIPKIIDKTIAKENLMIYKRILDKNNIRFLLMHGTLLGAIREHDFIDWDCDVDTYVYDEGALISIIPQLYDAGLKICRYSSIEYSFIREGVYIDAFVSRPCSPIFLRPFYCDYQFGRFPKHFFKKTEYIEFLGMKFEVSKNPERLLEYFYGKDWKTPKRGANSLNGNRRMLLNLPIIKHIHSLFS